MAFANSPLFLGSGCFLSSIDGGWRWLLNGDAATTVVCVANTVAIDRVKVLMLTMIICEIGVLCIKSSSVGSKAPLVYKQYGHEANVCIIT